jgi:hypothetical protein
VPLEVELLPPLELLPLEGFLGAEMARTKAESSKNKVKVTA